MRAWRRLRSPKVLTGPAAGIPSLTFRAWFVAQFGHAAWEELDKIPRLMWMDYLRWYRRVLALPIENDVEVQRIRPLDGLLALELADGTTILAGKVVMATGREGLGQPRIPDFMRDIPRHFWAHTAGRHRLRTPPRQTRDRHRRRRLGDGQRRRGPGARAAPNCACWSVATTCRASTS